MGGMFGQVGVSGTWLCVCGHTYPQRIYYISAINIAWGVSCECDEISSCTIFGLVAKRNRTALRGWPPFSGEYAVIAIGNLYPYQGIKFLEWLEALH